MAGPSSGNVVAVGSGFECDPFYRYKMPRLVVKAQGGGCGNKTVVENLQAVAKSLSRPPLHILKFFGYELGTSTQCTQKSGVKEYVLIGIYSPVRLKEILEKFITNFVICPVCDNPETIIVMEDRAMSLRCSACGNQSDLKTNLKMLNFMLKEMKKN